MFDRNKVESKKIPEIFFIIFLLVSLYCRQLIAGSPFEKLTQAKFSKIACEILKKISQFKMEKKYLIPGF